MLPPPEVKKREDQRGPQTIKSSADAMSESLMGKNNNGIPWVWLTTVV